MFSHGYNWLRAIAILKAFAGKNPAFHQEDTNINGGLYRREKSFNTSSSSESQNTLALLEGVSPRLFHIRLLTVKQN